MQQAVAVKNSKMTKKNGLGSFYINIIEYKGRPLSFLLMKLHLNSHTATDHFVLNWTISETSRSNRIMAAILNFLMLSGLIERSTQALAVERLRSIVPRYSQIKKKYFVEFMQ